MFWTVVKVDVKQGPGSEPPYRYEVRVDGAAAGRALADLVDGFLGSEAGDAVMELAELLEGRFRL